MASTPSQPVTEISGHQLYGATSCQEFIDRLEQLTKDLQIKFIDHPELQTLQLESAQPVYFVSSQADHSENLPGGSCGENMRAAYPAPDKPYEPLVTACFQLISSALPEIRMMDIGALWGHTSLLAAAMFKSSEVHLFEMNPITTQFLKKNIEANKHLGAHFVLNNVLLSDIDGVTEVTFKHYTARPKEKQANKISKLKVLRENFKSKLKRILGREGKGDYLVQNLPISRIDTYCKERNFIPNIIKIDVEGSQFDILAGAREILKEHHPTLLIEFDDPAAANYIGKSNRDVIKLLEGFGYQCFWGDHRTKHTKLFMIDSGTKYNIEVNSLGIFV